MKTNRTVQRGGVLCLALALMLASVAGGAEPTRPIVALDGAWQFHFGEVAGAERLVAAPADWAAIHLPHTWNAADGADGGNDYARGAAWYRTTFMVPAEWQDRRVILQFDGVSRVADVFVNGQRVGRHAGGFTRFRLDVTPHVRIGSENVLTVRVSNAFEGIPPKSADFTFFGGIYRNVALFATAPVHIGTIEYGADAVYLRQRRVSAASAELTAAVDVTNDTDAPVAATVRIKIVDASGATVVTSEALQRVAAHATATNEQPLFLKSPRLWDGRRDPHLYTAEVTVAIGGEPTDVLKVPLGLRSFSVDPDKGFFLNGAHVQLRGVNRHQDRAGKGWAIGVSEDDEDFGILLEMGANAVRVAHYPQSQHWFDLADRNGVVAWAEIPVVNEVPDDPEFAANARQQLRELIRQNFNHPAICFWGVGNETRADNDRVGAETPSAPAADALIAELAVLARAEDPTRYTTYASHHGVDDRRNFRTDVLGYNKYFGWYGGAAGDIATWSDDLHRRHPRLRFSFSEYGAGANVAQHDFSGQKPKPGGPWHPEEYQASFHETQWKAIAARPFIWGAFIWNLFDFASDGRAEGETPGLNDKGLVTYDRKTRKDAFYFYQATWSDAPVLHITSRRFVDRVEPITDVKVYSNAERVELFVNGNSFGAQPGVDRVFVWKGVQLATGANQIAATATRDGHTLADACTWILREPAPAKAQDAVAPTSPKP